MSGWRADVLGEGFDFLRLDLGEDAEGPVEATLVRSLPRPRNFWERGLRAPQQLSDVDVLYVHGWSDYFFQRGLAEFWTARGARFFALDLRKCGRSLREGQTPGYVEDLADYDLEIALALEEMGHGLAPDARSTSDRRLVLLGHSMGGLTLSLWADRHRGVADALILNSPWLELQLSGAVRKAVTPVMNFRASLNPRELALPQLDLGFYKRAQRMVADPREQTDVNPLWRPEISLPVLVGWFRAILDGHARVAAGLQIDVPVCVLLSARSQFGMTWRDEMLRSDTVLDVDLIARAAVKLGDSVTIERLDGALHDVFLSEPLARREAYARLSRWVIGWSAAYAPS